LIKDSVHGGSSSSLRIRLIKEKYFEHKCYCCNNTLWLDKPIPLELEHVNGDKFDNRIENLTLLCPNCHALTPTYRGKNKKIGNISRSLEIKKHTNIEKTKTIKVCLNCPKIVGQSKTGLCDTCYKKTLRTVVRPPIDQLLQEIQDTSFLAVGRKYGVSDNAIRKWIKAENKKTSL
jgi:Zn finger protein HypA/HybF involved in hydrogenase expression